MSATIDRKVCLRFATPGRPNIRLFCFPYAGVGPSVYRLWASLLPSVEVIGIQLPGRESRFREAPLQRIDEMVAEVAPVIRELDDMPFVFFGHSMGSLVAYEIARELSASGGLRPIHLFVSARRAPFLPDRDAPMRHLSDAAFVSEIRRRYGGIPDEVLEQPDLMALLLPTLRADVTALETYVHSAGPPLSCPITAFGGASDERALPEELAAWSALTDGPFRHRTFAGDHFYLTAHREPLLREIAAALQSATMAAQGVA